MTTSAPVKPVSRALAQLDREERLLRRRKRAIGQELAEIEQQLVEIAEEKRQESGTKIVAFRAETR